MHWYDYIILSAIILFIWVEDGTASQILCTLLMIASALYFGHTRGWWL